MSTTVARGRAIGIVVRIGVDTEVFAKKKKNHRPDKFQLTLKTRSARSVLLFSKAPSTKPRHLYKKNWIALGNVW